MLLPPLILIKNVCYILFVAHTNLQIHINSSMESIHKGHFVLILQRVWTGISSARAFVSTCTQAHIDIIITGMIRGVTGDPFLNNVCDSRTKVCRLIFRCKKKKKNSIMYEDERYVGKARSALWCISLIYYLADFQALILSTLEEESPFFLPPSPVPHVTSWLG